MSSSSSNVETTEGPTQQDKACAVLVREALFPLQKDWKAQHHVAIHPALDVLDKIRRDLVTIRDTPFSNLFPRKVMLVPVSGSAGREMQWNGQPDILDDINVEVVPDVLSVQCRQCPINDVKNGIKAYLNNNTTTSKFSDYTNPGLELVVCSNAVLQKDYDKFAARENAETLLEQRRDLPTRSLQIVEETLAHELTKLQVNSDTSDIERPFLQPPKNDCHKYAEMELLAARAAECLYEHRGTEIRKGSNLKPSVGFSLLSQSKRQDYISRCAQQVAIRDTSRVYGRNEATKCVKEVSAAVKQ
jgi:hypothetical protein